MTRLLKRRDGTVMAETTAMAVAFGVVALLTLGALADSPAPQLDLNTQSAHRVVAQD